MQRVHSRVIVQMFTKTSVQSGSHSKHSNLHPRSRKQTRYMTSDPTLKSIFSIPCVDKKIYTVCTINIHPEAIFCGFFVGCWDALRFFFFNSLIFLGQPLWDSLKYKNEQISVRHFCGKHAMGAKKTRMVQIFFSGHLRK